MSQGSLAPATQLFLLDTSVIIHLVRGAEVCQRILRSYDLIHCQPRPLVCVVSIELLAYPIREDWQRLTLVEMAC